MIESERQKRLLKLLREARRKEPDQDIRLVQMTGGVLFSRKRDRERAVEEYAGLWPMPLPKPNA